MSDFIKQVVTFVLSVFFACALLLAWLEYKSRPLPEPRREIRDVMTRLAPGATKTRVREVLRNGGYKHLELRESGAKRWLIDTPFETRAGNWLLWLEFENETLRALRLRVADRMQHRPLEAAPPDEIAADWKSDFPQE